MASMSFYPILAHTARVVAKWQRTDCSNAKTFEAGSFGCDGISILRAFSAWASLWAPHSYSKLSRLNLTSVPWSLNPHSPVFARLLTIVSVNSFVLVLGSVAPSCGQSLSLHSSIRD